MYAYVKWQLIKINLTDYYQWAEIILWWNIVKYINLNFI